MSAVHASRGPLKPASEHLRSEVDIVCSMAEATLGARTDATGEIPWDDSGLTTPRSDAASSASSTQTEPQAGHAMCRSPLAGATNVAATWIDRESDGTGVTANAAGADPASDHTQTCRTGPAGRLGGPSRESPGEMRSRSKSRVV